MAVGRDQTKKTVPTASLWIKPAGPCTHGPLAPSASWVFFSVPSPTLPAGFRRLQCCHCPSGCLVEPEGLCACVLAPRGSEGVGNKGPE